MPDEIERGIGFREVDDATTQRANRADWDAEADDYQAEHGAFLGDVRFVWSPEGVEESDVGLLGDVTGRRVVEIGCGAAQCSRWLQTKGAAAVGVDLSFRQLQHSRRIDDGTDMAVPVASAAVLQLPFADATFDIACSSFGALSFVVDLPAALGEVSRVLRPRGRLAFSIVHPVRRMFADDPTATGLTVRRSYFDRAAYVETDKSDEPSYVEPHHTLSDWTTALVGAGFTIESMIEPEWPKANTQVWGGWGPVRGALMPGTLLVAATSR